jgi:hypothetical protein
MGVAPTNQVRAVLVRGGESVNAESRAWARATVTDKRARSYAGPRRIARITGKSSEKRTTVERI